MIGGRLFSFHNYVQVYLVLFLFTTAQLLLALFPLSLTLHNLVNYSILNSLKVTWSNKYLIKPESTMAKTV